MQFLEEWSPVLNDFQDISWICDLACQVVLQVIGNAFDETTSIPSEVPRSIIDFAVLSYLIVWSNLVIINNANRFRTKMGYNIVGYSKS